MEQLEENEEKVAEKAANMRETFQANKPGSDMDVDELSNRDLLGVIADAFDKGFDAKSGLLVKNVGSEMEGIRTQLKQFGEIVTRQSAQARVTSTRAKYKDFDTFKGDILDTLKVYPGMDIEDAYMLAKSKKVGDMPAKNVTDTEKPSSVMTTNVNDDSKSSPVNRSERAEENFNTPKKGSTADFRAILNAGVNKVIDARKGVYSEE